ncbi:MAG: ABC-F family ATP-binding cassette domain-containing protein [Clostridia bacterium]|nr:ABC-F family ATP-binding cassette domain-containing protein [Clostridia bacterium]
MQFKISDAAVSFGANTILECINFEIKPKDRIAVVGRNGCGKTTLLKVISGEIEPDRNDSVNSSIIRSDIKSIGYLKQTAFDDDSVTLVDEIRKVYAPIIEIKERMEELSFLLETTTDETKIKEFSALQEKFNMLGGYYFEKEYETVIKKFGFCDQDKYRPLSDFSGGQRTKIAFIKLLLSKPDILLLDEPTNHLDIDSTLWLEDYINNYEKAVVIVSHDRMFLDKTVNIVYEIEYGETYRYVGNYTDFVAQKKIIREKQRKDYDYQQKEIARLEAIIERFKNKPTKVAMTRSKLKAIEHMVKLDAPENEDRRTFHIDFQPESKSYKDVLTVKDLEIGYDRVLSTVNVNIERGERVGIIGANGLGKSTFLKTIVAQIPAISGQFSFGSNVSVGYFDQQTTHTTSTKTVLEDFTDEFPTLTQTEARKALGAFLFTGDDVFNNVSDLSGGERVRLTLCKILRRKPNFLILDEPTNHMDIIGKETLEDILSAYEGSVLFVSHDRYFIKKIATSLLVFDTDGVKYYKYGYEQYLNSIAQSTITEETEKETVKKEKKTYTTPGKEKAKRERRLKKLEEQIGQLEKNIAQITEQLSDETICADYVKLEQLQSELNGMEENLLLLLEEWDTIV